MNNAETVNKYLALRVQLLAGRNPEGFWTGRLATSALSTAVAIVALKAAGNENDQVRINAGFSWLCRNINTDGGYGDTSGSVSNVSTTLLAYAAVKYCGTNGDGLSSIQAMEKWLAGNGISIGPKSITGTILKFYGKDHTFSIPILSMLSLCGVIPSSSLDSVPRLPFELALLPVSFYRFLNLGVVSYALPALIGVGIYLHKNSKKGILRPGLIRSRFVKPAIDRLNKLVPESGGFLEAIPLTGFVAMCLIASNEADNTTVEKGLVFLRNQQREDGGWPIDTDLSTWVTTLSVKALGPDIARELNENQIASLRNHLLRLQFKTIHKFNAAKPGGWGWTSYSGSLPDADDTSGAILALLEMYKGTGEELIAIENGCKWLIEIQNKDGGFPTFCKGWGKLPFDKSCADLTGHAILALLKAAEILHEDMSAGLISKIFTTVTRALDYLTKSQMDNGAWLPLWFGNQLTTDKTNPVYGTAKVCIYLSDSLALQSTGAGLFKRITLLIRKAQDYLVMQQNNDGSWGGKKGISGTVEETSLAVSALALLHKEECVKGIEWLVKQEMPDPAPIGLYFALLWYHEKLYPLIYYTEALRRFSG